MERCGLNPRIAIETHENNRGNNAITHLAAQPDVGTQVKSNCPMLNTQAREWKVLVQGVLNFILLVREE